MTKNPSSLPNLLFKREPRFIDSLRQVGNTTLLPQEIFSRLGYQLQNDLEESVLALMAGGLPVSNIEIRFEQAMIIENQISWVAQIMLTNLKDRAPENDQPPRPYYRGFLEPK